MLITRGCPYKCSYCCNHSLRNMYPNKSSYVRLGSVKHAINIIKNNLSLIHKTGKILFHDDIFTSNKKWLSEFCNAYEETKSEAEEHVLRKCEQAGIRLNIYRPSIVFGHSKTGRSMLFNAFYFPIRIAHYLKGLCEKDIKENEGRNLKHMGISRTGDGKIHLPIRLVKTEKSSFNLIPIDFLVDACMAIMEDSLEGDIFHLVSRKTCTIDEIIHYTQTMFDITGIHAIQNSDFDEEPKNALTEIDGANRR